MGTSTLLPLFSHFLIPLFLLLLLTPCIAQKWLASPCFPSSGNFTTNSTYHTNLNQLLSSFSSITRPEGYGFYNISVGQRNSSQVNGIAMCRGDVNSDICVNCIARAANEFRNTCLTIEAAQFYDDCMLWYSNKTIIGVGYRDFFYRWAQGSVSTNNTSFNDTLTALLERLRTRAAEGDAFRKFATGTVTVPRFDAIYALVQCAPDLSKLECSSCLSRAYERLPRCCLGRKRGRIFGPNCFVRYNNTLFYNDTVGVASPDSPPPPFSKPDGRRTRVIVIVVSTAVSVILISVCVWVLIRIMQNPPGVDNEIGSIESLQYDFDTIKVATNNFSDENKLGQGGFGAVYEGVLDNGQKIAVKRLSMGSGQGDQEFRNEVQLVARLQHRNLVRLHGFCLEGNERLLIYEFVPNSSLNHFLFDPIKRIHLDWRTRYKIIGGIAKGLVYLHEDSRLRIIHRDMKASNVLLDTEMNPKISDFGMAKLFNVDQTQDDTSRVVGTNGYMAPEYIFHGHISVKTDVYSFGVLVLEIVSGQNIRSLRHGDGEDAVNLLTDAWRNWREGTPLNIVDPNLRDGLDIEIIRCIHIGLLCVQQNVARRPTMGSIALMLASYSVTPPIPSHPAFFLGSTTELEASRSQSHESASVNEVSITELGPR